MNQRHSQPFLQAHCQSPGSHRSSQSFVGSACKANAKNVLKISRPLKNKKCHAQPDTDRQKSKHTMTLKHNTDNGLQGRWIRTPSANSVLPQLAVMIKIEAQ